MPITVFDVYGNYEVPEGKDPKEAVNEFYQLIGLCIKEWARIETGLFELCCFALQAPRKQASIIYYRSPSINTRLKLTDELIKIVLPQRERKDGGHDHPLVIRWNGIEKAIESLLPERNVLAHWPVRSQEPALPDGMPPGQVFIGQRWLEIAMSAEEQLRDHQGKEPMKHNDLQAHLDKVASISGELEAFYRQLSQATL